MHAAPTTIRSRRAPAQREFAGRIEPRCRRARHRRRSRAGRPRLVTAPAACSSSERVGVVQAVVGSSPIAHLDELPASRQFSGFRSITLAASVHQLSINFLSPVRPRRARPRGFGGLIRAVPHRRWHVLCLASRVGYPTRTTREGRGRWLPKPRRCVGGANAGVPLAGECDGPPDGDSSIADVAASPPGPDDLPF